MAKVRRDTQGAHGLVQESVGVFFCATHLELTDLIRNEATKCADFVQKYIDLQRQHGDRKEVSGLIVNC